MVLPNGQALGFAIDGPAGRQENKILHPAFTGLFQDKKQEFDISQKIGRQAVGRRGNAGQANYAAAKAGIIGLTKSLAKELGARGVRVNAIAPGYIDTPMTQALPEETRKLIVDATPLKSIGSTEDVANAVVFLASPRAHFITGVVLPVDGGLGI